MCRAKIFEPQVGRLLVFAARKSSPYKFVTGDVRFLNNYWCPVKMFLLAVKLLRFGL